MIVGGMEEAGEVDADDDDVEAADVGGDSSEGITILGGELTFGDAAAVVVAECVDSAAPVPDW